MLQAFQEGGWFMYVVLAVALLASVVAAVALGLALVQPTRQPAVAIGVLAMVLGIFVPATGAIGYALAMRQAFAAVAYADPASRATLLAQAISEAMNLIVFGAVCGAIPCLLGLTATVRAALRPAAKA